MLPPRIEADSDSIIATFEVEPLAGAQDCQSNPPTPFTLDLGEPLGERELRNGGPFPPERARALPSD